MSRLGIVIVTIAANLAAFGMGCLLAHLILKLVHRCKKRYKAAGEEAMSKWISVKKKLPQNGQIVWAYFGKDERPWTGMVMYTPNYITSLCEEDEGQWKGMGSIAENNWTHWMPTEPVKPPEPPKMELG